MLSAPNQQAYSFWRQRLLCVILTPPPWQMLDPPKPTALLPVFRFLSFICIYFVYGWIWDWLFTVDLGRQSLSSLIATLILIELPFARHYIIKKIPRLCHRVVCTNKKHIEHHAQNENVPILLKINFNWTFFPFARHIRLPFCDTILLYLYTYT